MREVHSNTGLLLETRISNNINLHVKELDKEEQTKPKERRTKTKCKKTHRQEKQAVARREWVGRLGKKGEGD